MDSAPQPSPKENENLDMMTGITSAASADSTNDAQIAVFTELIMKAIDDGWQEANNVVMSHKQAKLDAEAEFDRETMDKFDLIEKHEAEVADLKKTIEELEEKLRRAEEMVRERDEKLKEIESATSRV